jgi:hypothetical protein
VQSAKVKMMEENILLQNLICDHLNGCRDIAKIIVMYTEKTLNDLNRHEVKYIKNIFHNNGFRCFRTWELFVEKFTHIESSSTSSTGVLVDFHYGDSKSLDTTNLAYFNNYFGNTKEEQEKDSLLFIWTTNPPSDSHYLNCYLIRVKENDYEEEKLIQLFLKS